MLDHSAWILFFIGIQSQNNYGRQDVTEPVVTSNISVFHIQVEHVNHKKERILKNQYFAVSHPECQLSATAT